MKPPGASAWTLGLSSYLVMKPAQDKISFMIYYKCCLSDLAIKVMFSGFLTEDRKNSKQLS